MRAMSGLRRALGEPLLQFLVLGALLFAGYRLVHPERAARVEGNRVELTADDVRQLEIVWTAQWHRAPTQDELQGLVESRVREEILYREALALGLERGDTIIKRRLAQKMEFLADDPFGRAQSFGRGAARLVFAQFRAVRGSWSSFLPAPILFP